MPNSAFIIQGPDTQSANPYLALKIIDLGGGNFTIRTDELPSPVLPALASGITNSGGALLAGAAASIAIGATITGGTPGSVLFVGAGPVLAQDNANFFWDDTLNTLVLGSQVTDNIRLGGSAALGQLNFILLNQTALAPTQSTLRGIFINIGCTNNKVTNGIVATPSGQSAAGTTTSIIGGSFGASNGAAGLVTNLTGITGAASTNAAAGAITTGTGVQGNISIGGAADFGNGRGGDFSINVTSTGGVTSVASIIRSVLTKTGAGTIAALRGLDISGWNISGGNITNSDGIFIDNSIPNTTANHFAIRSLSTAPSLLTGELRLSPLTINGFIFIGANNAIQSTAAATDGQLLIGDTGSVPVAATLTPGTGISITNGAGSITIASSGLANVVAQASTPVNLTAADSGKTFINEGAGALIVFNLPGAAANLMYGFYVQDADGIRAVAAAGDTIRLADTVSAAAGNVESTTIGSFVLLIGINATEWVALSIVGTWTVT